MTALSSVIRRLRDPRRLNLRLNQKLKDMTVGELIKELQDYDEELELKIGTPRGDVLEISHLWQWDNSEEEPILNTYLTIQGI